MMRWAGGAIAVLIGGFAGSIVYMAVDNQQPTRIVESSVLTPELKAGGELVIRLHVIRDRRCPTHIDRFVYGANEYRRALEPSEFPAGSGPIGEEVYRTVVALPDDIPSGPARYTTLAFYKCNPLQAFWPLMGPQREYKFTVVAGASSGAPPDMEYSAPP